MNFSLTGEQIMIQENSTGYCNKGTYPVEPQVL